MSSVYRIQLFRWNFEEKEEYRAMCLKENLLGVGWKASKKCETLEEYKEECKDMGKGWKRAINAINKMQAGDYCWTLGGNGKYYLGRIEESSKMFFYKDGYDKGGVWRDNCIWKEFSMDEVPGHVISCLISNGTCSKIKGVDEYTHYLFCKKNK